MKKIILLILVVVTFSCCSEDRGCGVTPPDWIIGKWTHLKDSTETTTFEQFNIINRQKTPSGSFGISLCGELESGERSGVVEDVVETGDIFTFRVVYDSIPDIDYVTYFMLAVDTIGECTGEYPCASFNKLYR